jgi:hypothetical protein
LRSYLSSKSLPLRGGDHRGSRLPGASLKRGRCSVAQKAAPRTRYVPFQDLPRRVDAAPDLGSGNARISRLRTDRSFRTVRPHSQQSCEVFFASMTANRPPALAALQRSIEIIIARRRLKDLPLEAGLLPDTLAWIFNYRISARGSANMPRRRMASTLAMTAPTDVLTLPRPERSPDRRCGNSDRRTCARLDGSGRHARASSRGPRARRGYGN